MGHAKLTVRTGTPCVDNAFRDALVVEVHDLLAHVEVLEQRLKKRGLDSGPIIQKRLSVARQEIAQWKHFDYLIVSSSVEEDLQRMEAILEAEKMRQSRAQLPAYE